MAKKCVSVFILICALFAMLSLSACDSKRQNRYNPKDLIILKDSVTNLYYYADTNFRRVGELYIKAYAFQDKHAIVMFDSTYYIIDENFKIASGAIKEKYPQLKNDILVYSKNDSVVCYVNFKKNITKEFKAYGAYIWKNKALLIFYYTRVKDSLGKHYKSYRLVYSLDKEEIVQRDLDECVPLLSPFHRMKRDRIEDFASLNFGNYLYSRKGEKAYIADTNLKFTNYFNANYIFAPIDGFWLFIRDNKIGLMNMDFSLFLPPKFLTYRAFKIGGVSLFLNTDNEFYNLNIDRGHINAGYSWEIFSVRYVNLSDSLNSYILDTKNKSITKCQFTIIDELSDNLFFAYDNKQYFVIDYKGEKISTKSWKYYDNFEGEICVSNNKDFRPSKYIFNLLPHRLIKDINPFDYDCITTLHNGYSSISVGEYTGVFDKNYNAIVPFTELFIENYENPNIFRCSSWKVREQSEIRSTKTKEVLKLDNCIIEAAYDRYFAALYKDKADIYDNYFHKILSVPCDELKFLRSNIIEVNFKGKSRYIKL